VHNRRDEEPLSTLLSKIARGSHDDHNDDVEEEDEIIQIRKRDGRLEPLDGGKVRVCTLSSSTFFGWVRVIRSFKNKKDICLERTITH
jgi:hypothetical protein